MKMTKDIKQIQEENRKVIIMACNPKVRSYEDFIEALAKECLLDNSDGPYGYGQWIKLDQNKLYKCYPDENDDYVENDFLMTVGEFVANLLTLSRGLLGLAYSWDKIHSCPQYPNEIDIYYNDADWITWDLKKETLEEQTEETQIVINELLTKND